MSDDIQHIDIDGDDFIDAPKALREYAKKLKAANDQLTQKVTDLNGRVTESALSDVLTGFKNPNRVKRDLIGDKVDPLDKKAVEEWLAANGDDYARGEANSTTESAVDEGEVQAHQQIQNAAGGLRPAADMSKVQAFESEITKEMTGADIIALAAKNGL